MEKETAVKMWFVRAMNQYAKKLNCGNAHEFTKQQFMDGLQTNLEDKRFAESRGAKLFRNLNLVQMPREADGFVQAYQSENRTNNPLYQAAIEAVLGW